VTSIGRWYPFREADLQNAQLAGADFRNVRLRGANFNGANLAGVDFSGAHLEGATFFNADLSDASFLDAYLEGVQGLPSAKCSPPARYNDDTLRHMPKADRWGIQSIGVNLNDLERRKRERAADQEEPATDA
jgi:hypothetical protein